MYPTAYHKNCIRVFFLFQPKRKTHDEVVSGSEQRNFYFFRALERKGIIITNANSVSADTILNMNKCINCRHWKIDFDGVGKLPSSFMALPPQSFCEDVWDDITRMKTLNSEQARRNLTKHICPLQLDIIERLIERFSNKGDVVLDPFGGIMSVPYQAALMERYGLGVELNTDYYKDGLKHLKRVEVKQSVLELF